VSFRCGFRRFLTRLRRRSSLPLLDSQRQHDEPNPAKVLADG
jgi:hypothetical protein